jgi:hypothetical protein
MKSESYASDASIDIQLDHELACNFIDDLGVGRQDGDHLMKDYEIGSSIHDRRIMAKARKASDPVVIIKSARHKAQMIVLAENAFAIIDRKVRWCGQGR